MRLKAGHQRHANAWRRDAATGSLEESVQAARRVFPCFRNYRPIIIAPSPSKPTRLNVVFGPIINAIGSRLFYGIADVIVWRGSVCDSFDQRIWLR